MDPFSLAAVLLSVAALLAFANKRFLGLPSTIGVMALALLASGGLMVAGSVSPSFLAHVRELLEDIDFSAALLDVMLAFLLFAGALHVKLEDLAEEKWTIALLATLGVVVSTAAIGAGTWCILGFLGCPLPLIYCLLFGALISPTDPIAVLGILKTAGVRKSLETKVTGESLFNDGVGVVVFVALLGFANAAHGSSAGDIAALLATEVLGALVLGGALGAVTFWLMKQVDDHLVEVLLTLALCVGVFALANALHSSGPLAVVVAGLLIGNQGRKSAVSPHTLHRLDDFWELCDELLNVLLFVLIGLEVLIIPWNLNEILFGIIAIPLSLAVRFVSVAGTVKILSVGHRVDPGTIRILTWGGLRGGISIALALILRDSVERDVDVLLTATYLVVVFSIIVQGLTVGRFAKKIDREAAAADS